MIKAKLKNVTIIYHNFSAYSICAMESQIYEIKLDNKGKRINSYSKVTNIHMNLLQNYTMNINLLINKLIQNEELEVKCFVN